MSAGFAGRYNLDLIETYYQQWLADPNSVNEVWQAFFSGFELAGKMPSSGSGGGDSSKQTGVIQLIYAYRELGHFSAHLDPLNPAPKLSDDLDPVRFGLDKGDLDQSFDSHQFVGMETATLRELISALQQTYCRSIGVEYKHIGNQVVRDWLKSKMEPSRNRPEIPLRQKLRVLNSLHYAELFEKFLHTRYVGQKRFSLEGAETLIPILDVFAESGPDVGVEELILGMAHRGRLNVLVNILHKPYSEVFAEFEDNFLPHAMEGDGDVKYHLGFSSDHTTTNGKTVHLSLAPNPSHLEAVNPVVEGRTRAKQDTHKDTDRTKGVPVLIHGDAAFCGQGVVAETLNLAYLEGYTTGGTIHIVINNQVGFTTAPSDARSTPYCTDFAKAIQAPIFHVNGEDAEACVYVAELALQFRQKFRQDVVIDMYCYRRYGHNEGDEPTFTQPLMYEKIKAKESISAIYSKSLIEAGMLKPEEAEAITKDFSERLNSAQVETRQKPRDKRGMSAFAGTWKGMSRLYSHEPAQTAVSESILKQVGEVLTTVPEGFNTHPKVVGILQARRDVTEKNGAIDWAYGEALAFGTLLNEGFPVRLTGQDCRRGTFSHRHAALTDTKTGGRYIPLANVKKGEVAFDIYDSCLSEFAVMGFEYGYSLDAPNSLVLWEGQFGDFTNGAQVIIDQFIVSSETKWQRSNSLVLLLPHGYEGQGPEHSSARLERFLQACADDNIQVCNMTTPAQYFHVLRRQLHRNFRKPLVIMSPKSLLRHKDAVSHLGDLTSGHFHEILDDATTSPDKITRVVMCSGKVYYDLLAARTEKKADGVALVRMEQIYPWPEEQLRSVLSRYTECKEWVWAQEESQNMGAFSFVEPHLRAMGYDFRYVGRNPSASPAVGSHKMHMKEQVDLVAHAVGGEIPYLA